MRQEPSTAACYGTRTRSCPFQAPWCVCQRDGQLPPFSLSADVQSAVRNPVRLATLQDLQILDTAPDPDFDRLTALASSIFAAPIALVTLLDGERQWFKSRHGTEVLGSDVEASFCAHNIAQAGPHLVVGDMADDGRFSANPFVAGPTAIRFYAGAPIIVRGQRLGSVCVLDTKPRSEVPEPLLGQLASLAELAASLIELKEEARIRAETTAALQKEEWQHALTLEAGMVGSWVWDLTTDAIVVNDILLDMFGLSREGPHTGRMIFDAVHPDDLPRVRNDLRRSFEEGVDYASEFRLAHTGGWVVGRGRVYQRDPSGAPLVMMGINLDVNQSRVSADAMRVLLRELNHRVKNTLAMIQSLARQSLRRDPDPQHFIAGFSGRLRTLVEAHAKLADCDWAGVNLLSLIHTQVAGEGGLQGVGQYELEGGDLMLPPDHALGLGLVLHELSTNAARFGALSAPHGRVHLGWNLVEAPERRLELRWRETGGPPVSPPSETGLGLRLIQRSLDKVLGSKVHLDFAPSGLVATISLPLPDGEPA